MKTGVLLAFAALALAPCFVGAQHCGQVFVGRAPVHCAPPYVAPVAFAPVYCAPAFAFAPSYGYGGHYGRGYGGRR